MKLTKAPKWTNKIRSKLRATDNRVYEPEIARADNPIKMLPYAAPDKAMIDFVDRVSKAAVDIDLAPKPEKPSIMDITRMFG